MRMITILILPTSWELFRLLQNLYRQKTFTFMKALYVIIIDSFKISFLDLNFHLRDMYSITFRYI